MTAYQVISTQHAFSDRHKSVIASATISADDHATNVGIDEVQTAKIRNFPDDQKNLALTTAYLIAATNRDYSSLHALKRSIGTDAGVRNASGNVRPSLQRLARLRQIRLAAMSWKRLLRSSQADESQIAQAAAKASALLKELMK